MSVSLLHVCLSDCSPSCLPARRWTRTHDTLLPSQPLSTICTAQDRGWQFFQLFVKIAADHGGTIDLDEFYQFFELERTKFADRVFGILDLDQSGELSFQEFMLGCWNYCSSSEANIIKFAFDIFDLDGNGTLE